MISIAVKGSGLWGFDISTPLPRMFCLRLGVCRAQDGDERGSEGVYQYPVVEYRGCLRQYRGWLKEEY